MARENGESITDMKVLIINSVYKYGSIGQITYWFSEELKKRGHECLVAAGIDMGEEIEDGCVILGNKYEPLIHFYLSQITGYEGRYSPLATRKLIKIIDKYKPDVIQLFNLHGFYINIYQLLRAIKRRGIPTVYTMLDEHPYLGHCCYAYDCDKFQKECRNCRLDRKEYPGTYFFRRGRSTYKLKEKAYRNFSKLRFTAPKWVCERAETSSLLKGRKIYVVDEFIDVHSTFYIKQISEKREKLGISSEQVVLLNVALFSDMRKGGRFYAEAAKRLEKESKFVFIHIGYDGTYENLPTNFIPIGYIRNQNELADYFSLADKFICTSLADTMPNTCLEALACGTPVCGFDITGVPYVANERCGTFVEAGNVDQLVNEILKTEKKTSEMQNYCREYALSRYSVEIFCDKLLKIYEE